jgi:glutathione S-transferase
MSLHAARSLRQALEATAAGDAVEQPKPRPAVPTRHRRDQDPRPFLAAA